MGRGFVLWGRVAIASVAAALLAGAAGCGGDDEGPPTEEDAGTTTMCADPPGVALDGQGCMCDADCTDDASCVPEGDEAGWAQGMCFRECSTDADCSEGAVCGSPDIGLCLTPCDEEPCPAGRFCVAGHVCMPHCSSDDECLDGSCDPYTGSCAPPANPEGAGVMEPCERHAQCRSGSCGAAGVCITPCEIGADGCPDGAVCFSASGDARPGDAGTCAPTCTTSEDCPTGTFCSRTEVPGDQKLCIPEGLPACADEAGSVGDGWPCGCDSDCMPGALGCSSERASGYPGGRCYRECTSDGDCMGGAICDDSGVCKIPCSTEADCPDYHVCADGRCSALCQGDEQCAITGHCNRYTGRCTDGGGEDLGGVYARCRANVDCNSRYCSSDGRCLVACRVSEQGCPEDALCASYSTGTDLGLCYVPCTVADPTCPSGLTCSSMPSPPGSRVCR